MKWYVALFKNSAIMESLYNTLVLALLAAIISTILGTLACIAINKVRASFRSAIMGISISLC